MEKEVKVTHKGTEISYDEEADLWRFVLRGTNRKAKTLKAAREVIEKPVPKGKVAFERTPVYLREYSDLVPATVTSLVRSRYGDSIEAWVTKDERPVNRWGVLQGVERSKHGLSQLYARNEANAARVAEMKANKEKIDALEAANAKLIEAMDSWTLPKDIDLPEEP